MSSPSSSFIDLVLRFARAVRPLTGSRSLRAEAEKKASKPGSARPRWVGKDVVVGVDSRSGMTCYTLASTRPSGVEVLYLHGGSYAFEISPVHYWALGQLVRSSGATFTVVIYPLSPRSTADRTVAAVTAVADGFLRDHADAVIVGDSAGGGLALAVAQQLAAAGRANPRRLILISPWLDVTMSDPALDAIESKDPMLSRSELTEAGAMYAGALDPADPLASPVNGRMAGLPPITLFCGTNDMLLADSRALVTKAEKAGVPVDFHEQAGAQHVYPLLPTREGRAARALLTRALAIAGH